MNVPEEVVAKFVDGVDELTYIPEEAEAATEMVEKALGMSPTAPKPTVMKSHTVNAGFQAPDPDRFLHTAKKVCVDNYNLHRDSSRSPELTTDGVFIVWFAKTLGNWKAIVSSPVARGLMWEVTFNGHRGEVYLDVYKKTNNVKVQLELVKS